MCCADFLKKDFSYTRISHMILKIVIMHISKAQILVLEYHSHEKEPLFLKEMASEGLRRKIIKWIWIILWQKGYVSRIHLKREIFNQIRGSSTNLGLVVAQQGAQGMPRDSTEYSLGRAATWDEWSCRESSGQSDLCYSVRWNLSYGGAYVRTLEVGRSQQRNSGSHQHSA